MKQIYVFLLLFAVFFAGCSNQEGEVLVAETESEVLVKEVLAPTEGNFLRILATDKDGVEYLEKYPNTRLTNMSIIKPGQFESLYNNSQFKEMYVNLPEKKLYQIDFHGGGNLGLMTVIDLEDEKVLKIFGVFIMGMK